MGFRDYFFSNLIEFIYTIHKHQWILSENNNYIDNKTPPTIIFHGKNDTTIDPKTVVLFNQKMKKFGNKSELYLYEGKTHGFFNYGIELNGPFVDAVAVSFAKSIRSTFDL